MEKTTTEENVRLIKFPRWKRESVMKFVIALGMAGAGAGMVAAGLLAWVVGEEILLLTGVLAGSVFIAAGGLGFLKCLDGVPSK